MGQPLERLIAEYRANGLNAQESRLAFLRAKYDGAMDTAEFYTPEFQTEFWHDMFADDSTIIVPECRLSKEQIRRPMVDVRGNEIDKVMLVPSLTILQEKNGLVRLGKRYPSLGSWSVAENTIVRNTHSTTGYVKVEAVHNAPNLDTTQEQLEGYINDMKRQGRNYLGQRLTTYIPFGQALDVLTGEFPDLRTYARLPGSVIDDGMLFASRYSSGRLCVFSDLGPRSHFQPLGGRFEEVVRA